MKRRGCRAAPSRWSGQEGPVLGAAAARAGAEVAYDHMENGVRFRHTTQWRRWRPDRAPGSCTYAQLEEPTGYALADVLSGGTSDGLLRPCDPAVLRWRGSKSKNISMPYIHLPLWYVS